jgi:hypothetical protein
MALADLLHAAWSRLPRSWRERVPGGLRRGWHRTHRRHKPPLRLTFADATTSRRRLRVVIFGEFAPDWMAAFLDRALWTAIEGVIEVVRVDDTGRVGLPPPAVASSSTIVIPLEPDNIRHWPREHPSLVPDEQAVQTLGDKRAFAGYMAARGLGHLVPGLYASDAEAVFPCILKRTTLAAGFGIAVAHSSEELARLRATRPWHGEDCILQAFVPSIVEYVTHCVCRGGRILWHCTFACTKQQAEQIRSGMEHQTVAATTIAPRHLEQIAEILAPLGFSGPCSIDYRLSASGDLVIFEINPRFGGTLTLPGHRDRLREALACIIDHARVA